MANTIEKALSPIFLITFFLGLGIFRYPSNESRYGLSICYILTVWSVYAYVFYYTIQLFSVKNIFNTPLNLFTFIVNLFVTMISITIAICKHKKYQQCIRKLNFVDDTLEELGTLQEYRRMRNLTTQILITWFLITCVSVSLDFFLCISMTNDIKIILVPGVLNYCAYVNILTDIKFVLLLRYVGIKLDKINDHIEQLSKMEDYKLRRKKWQKSLIVCNYNIRDAKDCKHILWIVIHLHSELCRIARNINGFFEIQMTLQTMSYFVVLIEMVYYQYYTVLNYSKQIFNGDALVKMLLALNVWIMIFLIRLILLNHTCESVSSKAQKTKSIIHKLTNFVYLAEIREEICQFALQISLRPLKFSGSGLFYFGYNIIRKFFALIITSVLFLVYLNFPMKIITKNKDNVTYYK